MTKPTNKQLREFIADTFNDSELDNFCFDYFEDVDIPPNLGINDKAVELVRYCKRHDLMADLLNALKKERLRSYGREFGTEAETEVSVQPVSAPVVEPVPLAAKDLVAKQNANSFVHEKTGMEFVRIPAGMFKYGEKGKPRPLSEYWISKTPVTHAVYKRFIDAVPEHRVPNRDEQWAKPYNWDENRRIYPLNKAGHPVVLVSWHDAIAFCKWAGLMLPTEEQWEKAARGTDGRTYPWGEDEPTDMLCNFNKNIGKTTPVGGYSPQGDSPYGCVDMSGNMFEWCLNKYKTSLDTSVDDSDASRVLRGGSWFYGSVPVCAAYRNHNIPDGRFFGVGFRCVSSFPISLAH